MMHHRSFAPWRLVALATIAVLALVPAAVQAQETGPDGEPVANPRSRRFGATRDEALADLRSAGYFTRVCLENLDAAFNIDFTPCGPFFQTMNNGFTAVWPRQASWGWGVPPTEWNKAKALVPSLANAIGGGWTVSQIEQTGFDDTDAADNSLGLHHSGVTSTSDRSCLDPVAYGSGNPWLAASNCPETWGTEGWKGARPIPLEVWQARYAADPTNFNFDFWRVSDAELDAAGITPPSATSAGKTIGNFQAYGFTSDYTQEILCGTSIYRNYAHVIPTTSPTVPGGCVGSDAARRRHGWPLGIEVRVDAFTFQLPALKEISYYQLTFTNRSEQVYGVPLDYDSFYLELHQGYFGNSNIQQNPEFWMPSLGTMITSALPLAGPCVTSKIVSDLTCARWGTNFGFVQGASALIILKSPIGDLRNKLFNRPTSPFYDPTHPLASDTFTMQHGHLCGFRACGRNNWATNPDATPDHERRGFGQMASMETDVLGDRTVSSLTDQVYWHTFRNYGFPTVRYTPGDAPSVGGGYNKWAPSMQGINWDWGGPPGSMNPKDGVQDTMSIDGCWINGCAAPFNDTLPNGKYAAYSNTHGTMGVGPIRLMADSTVSYVIAITTAQANDSAGFMSNVLAAIDNYMNFYLAPDAAPKCKVVGVTRASSAEGSNIGITWDDSCFPGQWTDAFLNKQYNDLVAAPGNSPLGVLRQLNPWLDDTLNFLRTNNLKTLYLFKSCNDGGVWTTADDCINGSPLIGTTPLATLGWQPYQTYDADAANGLPSTYVDRNVRNGQTYTYNLIGETRGASLTVINGDSVGVVGTDTICAKNCRVETLSLAPVLLNTLSSSTGEVNVARSYLPVSVQAGGRRSVALVTDSVGPVAGSRLGITVQNDSLEAATYRVLFGNSATASQLEFTNNVTGKTDSVKSKVVLRTDLPNVGDSLVINGASLYRIDTISTSPLQTDTVLVRLNSLTESGATVTRSAINPLLDSVAFSWGTTVMALARYTGGTPADALLVTSTLTGGSATPGAFHSNQDYPKFDLSIDATIANAFQLEEFRQANGSPVPPLVAPTVTWLSGRALQNQSTSNNEANGDYAITWGAQAFGTGGSGGSDQFRCDFSNPGACASAVNASLTARTVVSTAVTTDSAAAAVQAATGLVTTIDSLNALQLPFTIQNLSYGRNVLVAARVRPAGGKTIVVGTGADTFRVAVPDNVWVPGDELYLIERLGAGTGVQAITFQRAVIGCDPTRFSRESCNPLYPGTRGASVYLSPTPGQYDAVSYAVPLTGASAFTVTARTPLRSASLVGQADSIRAGLAAVRVVPNPYVMLSQYAGNVLLFTHVPPRGSIRIYTVAGQFVQQITWSEANLGANGDLSWNLRTREGNLLGAGLYIYVLTAEDASGGTIGTKTDKFVIVR